MNSIRYYLLDALRGLAIICMIIYHYFYDITFVFAQDYKWIYSDAASWLQVVVAGVFIFISGSMSHLSNNALRHSLQLIIWGLVINIVTYFYTPHNMIVFGILSFLGTAAFLTAVLKKQLLKIKADIGTALAVLLFLVTYQIPQGKLIFGTWEFISLPASWYQYEVLAPFGLPSDNFTSSDYFPLLPWVFVYFMGFYVWLGFSESFKNTYLTFKIPLITTVGQKSLWIYLLHQPVLITLLTLKYL